MSTEFAQPPAAEGALAPSIDAGLLGIADSGEAGGGEPAAPPPLEAALPEELMADVLDYGLTPETAEGQDGTRDAQRAPVEAGVGTIGEPTAEAGLTAGDGKSAEAKGATAQDAGTEAGKKSEAGAATDADRELSPEENALVESRPEAERAEVRQKLKAAKFEGNYLNPAFPPKEVADYLHTLSPSRAEEVLVEMAGSAIGRDPARFGVALFEKYPDQYGHLVVNALHGAPDAALRVLLRRSDVTVADVLKRLEGAPVVSPSPVGAEQAAAEAAPEFEVTEDFEEDLRKFFPDEADAMLAKLKAAPTPKAEPAPQPAQPTPEQAKEAAEAGKTGEGAQAQQQQPAHGLSAPEHYATFDKGVAEVEGFITSKLDDPAHFGLAVSAEERTQAPEVARYKEMKRDAVLKGNEKEGVPGFEQGFVKWVEGVGSERDKALFNEVTKNMAHFARRGEEANVLREAGRLKSLADIYLTTARLKHPYFAWLDTKITEAAASAQRLPHTETVTTGAGAASRAAAATDPGQDFMREALSYGLEGTP